MRNSLESIAIAASGFHRGRLGKQCGTGNGDSWFENGGECPVCAKRRDPVTGEPRYNAETAAAFKEGDAMLRGETPANWHHSIDELDRILGL